jgi:hypothetical protein
MKVEIDISVLRSDGVAFGRIFGPVEFAALPPIGSKIIFSSPRNPVDAIAIDGFKSHLAVENVLLYPSFERDVSVLISLEDITVNSRGDAQLLVKYLTEGFDLFFDEYFVD